MCLRNTCEFVVMETIDEDLYHLLVNGRLVNLVQKGRGATYRYSVMIYKLTVAKSISQHGNGRHNLASQYPAVTTGGIPDHHSRVRFATAANTKHGLGEELVRVSTVLNGLVMGTLVDIRIT